MDLDDLDQERRGWTRDELVAQRLATRPHDEDVVVCHGDLCLPNVLLDRRPEFYRLLDEFFSAARKHPAMTGRRTRLCGWTP